LQYCNVFFYLCIEERMLRTNLNNAKIIQRYLATNKRVQHRVSNVR
jgi:hypothetical protein